MSLGKFFKNSNYFNVLLALLPISFVAGNLIINLNTIIIIISSVLLFGKDLFKIKFLLLDKFIYIFFALILFTAVYNDINFIRSDAYPEDFYTTKKSILFLRYLFLYISVRYLIEKKLVSLKFFFSSCLLSSLFVSFDIFYQFIFREDIFGYKVIGRRLSGPFGDELIAGGYLSKFSIIALFSLPLFYNKSSKHYLKFLIPAFVIIFISAIILSGNRMPFIMYIFTLTLIAIFQSQVRKYFFIFVTGILIIFFIGYKFNNEVRTNFNTFYIQVSKMAIILYQKDFDNKNSPLYFKQFYSFYDTWLMNKYVGGGIKNFRYYCHVRPNQNKESGFICNMHPHNYYLEILTETGLIGFIIVILIFIQIIYLTFYKKYLSGSKLKFDNAIIPFIFLFIAEIFPLKSTGSFFTTNNATLLFLIIAILIGLVNRNNLIENKK